MFGKAVPNLSTLMAKLEQVGCVSGNPMYACTVLVWVAGTHALCLRKWSFACEQRALAWPCWSSTHMSRGCLSGECSCLHQQRVLVCEVPFAWMELRTCAASTHMSRTSCASTNALHSSALLSCKWSFACALVHHWHGPVSNWGLGTPGLEDKYARLYMKLLVILYRESLCKRIKVIEQSSYRTKLLFILF